MSTEAPIHADPSVQAISVRPVVLPAPDRGHDLEVRVSAPASGGDLPVVVFSHGFGWSMDGYGPVADHWAAHGFVVVQPTHLDSTTLALSPDDPRTPRIWRYRVDDLVRVIDELDRIEAAVPGLAGRVDRTRIAAAGHSWGATSASALLGARVLGDDGDPGEDMSDSRVTAGVLLALAGTGGNALTPFAAEQFPFMNPDFSTLTTPALLVAGEKDQSLLSVRGPDWWTDGYHQSPGAVSLLTVFGAEHSLGGIVTHLAAKEMSDAESPEMLALVQRVTTAYLRRALGLGNEDWVRVHADLASDAQPLGRMESK
jgi:dienelactone hydrolase